MTRSKGQLPQSAGSMHTRISPTWDVGIAIRYAESIGYKGLYTIEVSQDTAVQPHLQCHSRQPAVACGCT